MGFIADEKTAGPLSVPAGLNITPDAPDGDTSILGAAFRMENPIGSLVSSYEYDPIGEFDPDFRPHESIQGTQYEPYSDRFVGARNAEELSQMKLQIDRELEDRRTLDAAGAKGFLAQMGAAVLSPTSLIPGGVVVKSAQGVRIGATGLNVAASAGFAAALDEAVLHGSQQTRTGTESAFAIGGSMVLGGILGVGAGSLSRAEFRQASMQTETAIQQAHEFVEGARSLSAAENAQDFTVKREGLFGTIRNIPFLRGIVRSDPNIRTMLAPSIPTRAANAEMVESPLQWKVNEEGQSVRRGEGSVEGRIIERTNVQMDNSLWYLRKTYGEYWKDGPVGTVGTMTAPMGQAFAHLAGRSQKLSATDFMNEVGRAMRRGDKHPIPQVQAAAEHLRKEIFDPIKDEMIELGIVDGDDLKVKNADSYFTRVYNTEKIAAHRGDGTPDDITSVLMDEFFKRSEIANQNLAFDKTLDNLQADQFRLRESLQQNQTGLKRARKKAADKKGRAEAAIKREGAVGRATAAMRRVFRSRADDLKAKTLSEAEKSSIKEMLKDARGVNKLRPTDILAAIRGMGGIKDERIGTRWTGRDWAKEKQTDLERALDTKSITIRRKDGKDIDTIREALVEDGYLDEGATVDDLIETLRRAADGEDVFSRYADPDEMARYDAAVEFREAMAEAGVDISKGADEVIADLSDARNVKITEAKAKEAGRSEGIAGKSENAAMSRIEKAMERLESATERLRQIDEEIGPKVREDIKTIRAELRDLAPKIKEARKDRDIEEMYANASEDEIRAAVNDTVDGILGLKAGEASYRAAFANPTRARVLDVADELLEPWLESNAQNVMAQYFRSIVPDMEITRTFGDLELSRVTQAIEEEANVKLRGVTNKRARNKIIREKQENIRDLEAMKDRLRGTYGAPKDPRSGWVKGSRTMRTVSFMGYLGGMVVSAIPDVSNVIGRAGIGNAFGGAFTMVTKPKRLGLAAADMAEVGAAAEWHLNTRAMAVADLFDPYSTNSKLEQSLATGSSIFSRLTGMTAWNAGWKSVGGAMVASKMSKAAMAVRNGTATKKQLEALGANDIEPWMAERIAEQLTRHGDMDGTLWLPRGQNWDDQEAFLAFRRAMNREFNIMIVTPGQDLPLSFSSETGKFFLQFKSFAFSSHHRLLLAGIQRADADVLAQVVTAVALGGLVSNIKAEMGDRKRKEGAAFWEDSLDRSGLMGWLMEPYNIANGFSNGALSISGEPVSRYKARSVTQGAVGPSVDMVTRFGEALNAYSSESATYRDTRALMRPVPGNNLVWLLPLIKKIEDAAVEATGARPKS